MALGPPHQEAVELRTQIGTRRDATQKSKIRAGNGNGIEMDAGRTYLHQKLEVDIVRLRRGAAGPLVPAAGDEVDSLPGEERSGDCSAWVHGYRDEGPKGPRGMLPWRRAAVTQLERRRRRRRRGF